MVCFIHCVSSSTSSVLMENLSVPCWSKNANAFQITSPSIHTDLCCSPCWPKQKRWSRGVRVVERDLVVVTDSVAGCAPASQSQCSVYFCFDTSFVAAYIRTGTQRFLELGYSVGRQNHACYIVGDDKRIAIRALCRHPMSVEAHFISIATLTIPLISKIKTALSSFLPSLKLASPSLKMSLEPPSPPSPVPIPAASADRKALISPSKCNSR